MVSEVIKKISYFFRTHSRPLWLLSFIIVISLIPRLWNLRTSPPIIVDEPANLRDISLIKESGLKVTYFHWDYSKSRIVHLPVLVLIKAGITDELLALRLASVILSIFSLIPFFFIVKKLTDNFIAFAVTLLFSFSYYFLQFSRVGWTDVISVMLMGFILIAISLALKKRLTNYYLVALSGIISGLIFYSYRSGIIFIAVFFISLISQKSKGVLGVLKSVFVFWICFLVITLPWLTTINQNKEKYNLRLRVVSIKNVELPYHEVLDKKDVFSYQIKRVFNSWIVLNKVDSLSVEGQRYLPNGYSAVNVLIKIGFWLGAIFGLFKIKKTFPLYLILILGLYGQLITVDPPNGARGLVILPCIYILFSLFYYQIYIRANKNKLVLGLLLLLSLLFSYIDWEFYKMWMSWIEV